MVKGGFIVVEYSGWGESAYTEIVNEEDLRPKNTNPPIDANTFHKFEIPVPEELREEWVFFHAQNAGGFFVEKTSEVDKKCTD